MMYERTAAFVLALACICQTREPSWTIQTNCPRKIDVQIGSLRIQATTNTQPKRLKICINERGCLTTWWRN